LRDRAHGAGRKVGAVPASPSFIRVLLAPRSSWGGSALGILLPPLVPHCFQLTLDRNPNIRVTYSAGCLPRTLIPAAVPGPFGGQTLMR
jgi:hypothetical protein